MRKIFVYVVASHGSSIMKQPEVLSTLNKLKENDVDTLVFIKKTQIVSKARSLKKDFKVELYPKSATEKAIRNADGCLIISDGLSRRRKHSSLSNIVDTANKYGRLVLSFVIRT